MADHSKRTGPAVEAHLFLLWLIPTIEHFPKSHKFVLGDRALNVGLDVLELLWRRPSREIENRTSAK